MALSAIRNSKEPKISRHSEEVTFMNKKQGMNKTPGSGISQDIQILSLIAVLSSPKANSPLFKGGIQPSTSLLLLVRQSY